MLCLYPLGQFVTLLGLVLLYSESHRPSGASPRGFLKSFTNLTTVITDRRVRPLYFVNFLLYLCIFGFFRVYPMYLVRDFHVGVARESVFVAWVAVPIVVANLWLVGRLSRRWSARSSPCLGTPAAADHATTVVPAPDPTG